MPHHDIKIHPQHFLRVQSNEMPFQIRNNDRNYQERDTLRLREWKPDEQRYTGLEIHRVVNRVYTDIPGLQEGYCAFSIRMPFAGQ